MTPLSKSSAAIALFCASFLLFSQAAYSQEFSAIDQDLAQLEDLIKNTITNTEEQQKLLEDLRQSLNESGSLIESYEQIMTERGYKNDIPVVFIA
jgi:flagellar motility protein MotE (MotC chaperone)